MKKLRYLLEGALLGLLLFFFKALPPDTASNAGGAIGRAIGPRLAASRKALRHMKFAMPDMDEQARKKALAEMWDNLGRVMAEYSHLEFIGKNRVSVHSHEKVEALFQDGKPCLMIAGHLANWEIAAAAMLNHTGRPLDLTYRAPNNPWADRLLLKARTLGGKIKCYPKSRDGGQAMVRAMREGRYLAMLIDQKYNEGVAAPFFGHDAMTNPVFVQLARKFNYPLVPARIERVEGTRFDITLHEPIYIGDESTEEIIDKAHAHLENWIRQRPGQWLWLHRRWTDS